MKNGRPKANKSQQFVSRVLRERMLSTPCLVQSGRLPSRGGEQRDWPWVGYALLSTQLRRSWTGRSRDTTTGASSAMERSDSRAETVKRTRASSPSHERRANRSNRGARREIGRGIHSLEARENTSYQQGAESHHQELQR
jgi:hypothetical protein